MSSKKDTKLLFEGWRKFLSESEISLEGTVEDDQKVISVFDFDGTLVESANIDVDACLQYVLENAEKIGDKINVSTDPDAPSPRTEKQIKSADIAYYSNFFSILRNETALAKGHFATVKNSQDTYVLTKLRLPETTILKKENWVYKWFEQKFDPKTDVDSKTIGEKKRKYIREKIGFSGPNLIICQNKQDGIMQILKKYQPENVLKLDLYDNSQQEMNDAAAPARKYLGEEKVKEHLVEDGKAKESE